jgi:transcriptional regulator with XRE-family HTH domain
MSTPVPDEALDRKGTAVTIGRIMRTLRESRGLSQEAVAFQAGISVQAYSCLERGQTPSGGVANPTLDTLLRIFTALEIQPPEGATLVFGPCDRDANPVQATSRRADPAG